MHADLFWLAENVTEWHNKLDRIARQPYGPHWFDQNRFPHWEGFTREQWQAARDQMSKQGEPSTKANAQLLAERLSYAQFLAEKLPYWRGDYTHCSWIFEGDGGEGAEWPRFNYGQGCSKEDWKAARGELEEGPFSCHESPLDYADEESPIDAFERECNQDSANSTFSSPEEPDIWADAPDEAEYYGTMSKRFYKMIAGIPCSAFSWNDQDNFWQFTIMPTDEFEGPGFIKRPPDDQAMPADLEHMTDDITAYDPPGPTTMPECTFTTPDEDEAWAEAERRMDAIAQNGNDGLHYNPEDVAGVHSEAKQARYQDTAGEDWIDEAARTFTPEEFRGAMRFSIGKYNRRMGKKDDLIKEIEKMRDYCQRWIDVEQGR